MPRRGWFAFTSNATWRIAKAHLSRDNVAGKDILGVVLNAVKQNGKSL